ncbi:MAG: sigma-54 dependent transcriptional regulator [Muribaculaceae bacterium]|nr:sigma-54 dependent transcriptional regulator [Muribaculaceae bacterium]
MNAQVQQAKQRFGIIGNAPALTAAVERAIRVAPIDLSVLVTGESGTGKEFFPQIIHAYSPRKHAKYIAVNCGAIPEGTIDSELFGHEKGAFTGAVDARKGYFEEANGGTIFLDEVAELPLTTQARLLRVLESGEFIKVGSSTVQRTNIRVVAATNVDLIRAVADGRFREDLYYRLSTVQIHIPPLRDRGSDIKLLTRKFTADFAERYHVPEVSFSPDADDALRHYRWPGNVRQLKNVVEQVALFEGGKEVDESTLRSYLPDISASYMPVAGSASAHSYEREREMLLGMVFKLRQRLDAMQEQLDKLENRDDGTAHILGRTPVLEEPNYPTSLVVCPRPPAELPAQPSAPCSDTNYSEVLDTPPSLEDNERELIRRALDRNDGRRKAAAVELGISERTLYRKIKEYDLE